MRDASLDHLVGAGKQRRRHRDMRLMTNSYLAGGI